MSILNINFSNFDTRRMNLRSGYQQRRELKNITDALAVSLRTCRMPTSQNGADCDEKQIYNTDAPFQLSIGRGAEDITANEAIERVQAVFIAASNGKISYSLAVDSMTIGEEDQPPSVSVTRTPGLG